MENIKYEVVTPKNFESALKDVIDNLSKVGFGVLWKLNFKEKLIEKGLEFDRNFMILEVCNPHKAKEVLSRHIDVGYFLPCRVVVYEDGENVRIGMLNTGELLGMLGYDDISDLADEVQKTLEDVINSSK